MPAKYKVYIDWSNNGTFTDTGDDVSSRTLDGRTPLVIRYGRDQARALSPISPGEVNLELNNISRDYSPEFSGSPLAGKVLPGRSTLIQSQPLVFASDNFGRTSSSSWGTSTTGQAWTVTGTATNYSVSSGLGRQANFGVASAREAILPVVMPNGSVIASFSVPVTALGNSIDGYVVGRRIDASNHYRGRLSFNPDGTLQVAIELVLAGVTTLPGALTRTEIPYTTGTLYSIELQMDGTILRARVWAATDPPPSTWHLEISDTGISAETAAASSVGVRTMLRGANTNTLPVTVSVDDFAATLGTQNVFAGQLDDFTVKPNLEDRSIDVSCLDVLGRLRGIEVSTELYSGIRTGEALGRLLDAAGWSATARDIDPGATVMPWWWADAEDCFDAAMKLVNSEGPTALLTSDGNGKVVFRDRHHRLVRAASLTSQSTWRSGGTVEPVLSTPAAYNHGWKEIVNVIDFDVSVRRPDGLPSAVWNSQDRITLSAGETATLTAKASNPFFNAIVPVQGTDYTLVTGTANISLTKLSGQSTTVTILAVGGTTIIDGLQVRATAVQTVTSVLVHAEDSTSIRDYGRRSLPDGFDPVWASVYDAQAVAQLILGKRADRVPTVSVVLVNANNTRLVQQLTRNLSDRVHAVLTQIGLDADCFIEQIQHQIGQGGLEHRTTFGLEKAPVPTSNPFTFDLAGAGFDQGNFTGTGSDNPSTMFLFDTPGQGFDQGVFAF